jgi:lysophospholipase L1-like esterase
MKHILVYADSLSWGIVPGTRRRLEFADRWPGVLEDDLRKLGESVRVIEDCLNGRRTVWEDPFKPGRNGSLGLAQRIEIHSPLALVMLMLGTNDFQSSHSNTAWHSAQGLSSLVAAIRSAPIEPGMPIPPIMIVAPPPIFVPTNGLSPKFAGGEVRCVGLANAYREVANALRCSFFDSATIIRASEIDGVHLDKDAHWRLGHALTEVVAPLLQADSVN